MILNGDVFSPAELPRAYEATAADSIMCARGALWNPSIFQLGRQLPMAPQVLPKCSNHTPRLIAFAATHAFAATPRPRCHPTPGGGGAPVH